LAITLAVAGLPAPTRCDHWRKNQLVIRGRQQDDKARQYIHRGIAARHFQRTFVLARDAGAGADLKKRLLSIDLARLSRKRSLRPIAINEHE